jgi:hypothetical protein
MRVKGIKLPHLGLMLPEKTVFDSRYKFSALHRVAFIAPLAGQEIIQWPATMRTTPVPDRVHFSLLHGHAFGDWGSFNLQLL